MLLRVTNTDDPLRALDEVIWSALTTEHASFAERVGSAARYAPAVTALAGLAAPTPDAFADLARLLAGGDRAGLFVDPATSIPSVLRVDDEAELAQRVQLTPELVDDADLVVLGAADAPAMIELVERTRPGPFGTRTHELGLFLGVREGARLVAMAGRRMRLPGLVEISAVCTHPDHLGRGHAARLMAAQAARIHAEGAVPFLHVRADNTRAIALYERLGFVERRRFRYCVVRAAAA